MKNSPADILKKYFILNGDVGFIGASWPAYTATLPDTTDIPDNIVSFFDSSPENKGRSVAAGTLYRWGVQIRVRAFSYCEGYEKCLSLNTKLDSIHREHITFEGVSYLIQNVTATTGIIPLGLEEGQKKRYHWSLNLLITINEE